MIVLGVDPGLRFTGWGVVEKNGPSKPVFVDCGVIAPKTSLSLSDRLVCLHQGLSEVIRTYQPQHISLEEVFINSNGASTLKLGQARGVILMTPALLGLPVFEYAANTVKKVVTGAGHADKKRIHRMLDLLLNLNERSLPTKADATDALAVALCHLLTLKI